LVNFQINLGWYNRCHF